MKKWPLYTDKQRNTIIQKSNKDVVQKKIEKKGTKSTITTKEDSWTPSNNFDN